MFEQQKKDIYGRGWVFPPTLNADTGVAMVMNHDDIRQSLIVLFSTQPGERIMRPDYGCDLQSLMFENISAALIADVHARITDAVLRHEQRVVMESLEITQDAQRRNTLQIRMAYRVRGTDSLQRLEAGLDLGQGDANGTRMLFT